MNEPYQDNQPNMIGDVTKFHLVFGHTVATVPYVPAKADRDRRNSLNTEEFREIMQWVQHPNWYDWDQRQKYLALDESEQAEFREKYDSDYTHVEDPSWEVWKIKALAHIADGIGDLIYVLIGMALQYGLPLDKVWNAIQTANMAKLGPDGKPIYRQDGKVLKPAGWKPPDIEAIIREAMVPIEQDPPAHAADPATPDQ